MTKERVQASTFVAGGTLPFEAESYVEREADLQLLDALLDGRYCFVLNARQMGKSSLCVRTMRRLQELGHRPAFVDLTRMGSTNVSAEQWYTAIAIEVARGLGLRTEFVTYWKEHAAVAPMQRFFAALRDVALVRISDPIVVLLDEIDATRSLSFNTDEFFAGIRECFNRRVHEPDLGRLTFCLLGVAVPSDLIRDARTTPFNIGERIDLRDFKIEEAMQLADALGENGSEAIRRIHYWTGGHPFLTQSLCRSFASNGARNDIRAIDDLVKSEFFEPAARESNINLADVGKRVLNGFADDDDADEFRATILNTYGRALAGKELPQDDESNRVSVVLKLSGLMSSEAGRLRVRNRIYRHVFDGHWIRENMPGQEIRRQRKAYFRGLLLAGSVATVVLGTIATLAVATYREAKRADGNLRIARQNELNANRNAERAKESEGQAKSLLKDLDKSLRESRELGERERSARLTADRRSQEAIAARKEADRNARKEQAASLLAALRGREANERSYDVYLASIKLAQSALSDKRYDQVHAVLNASATQPRRGWEYGVLKHALAVKDRSFQGHKDALNAGGFSPNGERIVTGDFSGEVNVWNAHSGKRLRRRHWGFSTWSFAVSPNGKQAATSARTGGMLAAMDLDTGRVLWKVDTGLPKLNKVVYSADGGTIGGCGPEGRITFVQASNGKLLDTYQIKSGELASISISPDGGTFVVGSLDFNAYVCDRWTGSVLRTLKGHTDWVWGVSYSRNGQDIVTTSVDRTAKLWRALDGGLLATLRGHVHSVIQADNSPDGSLWVTSCDDSTARIWNREGQLLDTLTSHNQAITGAWFSPDGSNILTVSRDHTARIWPLDPTPGTKLLARFPFRVLSVDATQGGKWIIAGSTGGARVIELSTGRVLKEISLSSRTEVLGASLTPDLRYAALSDSDAHAVHVFDLKSGDRIQTFPKSFVALRFAPDGSLLAMEDTDDWNVRIYETGLWRLRKRLVGPKSSVVDIGFSPNGRLIAASSYDRHVYVWEAATSRLLAKLGPFGGPVWPVAFSLDGKWLAGGDNMGNVKVYDVPGFGLKLAARGVDGPLEGVAITPDSKTLISTGMRGDVRLFNISDGREVVTFQSNTGQNRRCAMLPDGKLLVGGGDGSLRIWDPNWGDSR